MMPNGVNNDCEGITLLRRQVEELHKQHVEVLSTLRQLAAIAQKHLDIALEYKEYVGDPLLKGRYALMLLRSIFAWVAGTLLTLWGLKEIFDAIYIPRPK